jgi:hypothetical protein
MSGAVTALLSLLLTSSTPLVEVAQDQNQNQAISLTDPPAPVLKTMTALKFQAAPSATGHGQQMTLLNGPQRMLSADATIENERNISN